MATDRVFYYGDLEIGEEQQAIFLKVVNTLIDPMYRSELKESAETYNQNTLNILVMTIGELLEYAVVEIEHLGRKIDVFDVTQLHRTLGLMSQPLHQVAHLVYDIRCITDEQLRTFKDLMISVRTVPLGAADDIIARQLNQLHAGEQPPTRVEDDTPNRTPPGRH